ncbi:MAG: hypothetical protein NKF70_10675 [Methanobacterium sp. ERen5]|nr:MAG: hypothetical protein NKF70_10675 [Methanobacterium sp. ERen5]
MPLLKDTEREQLRQLVKACLLEISKLKIELKKCQKESSNSTTNDLKVESLKEELSEHIQRKDEEIQESIKVKDEEIGLLKTMIEEMNQKISELETVKIYFEAVISPPRRNLTSFQSQIYELLPCEEQDTVILFSHLRSIGFKELSHDNLESALKNLERKGYFKSRVEDGKTLWKKQEK